MLPSFFEAGLLVSPMLLAVHQRAPKVDAGILSVIASCARLVIESLISSMFPANERFLR